MTPLRISAAATILIAATMSTEPTAQLAPLTMGTARVTIAGTSNIHNYSVWTDTVRLTGVRLAGSSGTDAFWEYCLKPGALARFEFAVPVATLTSRDAGLDRTMYEALKLEEHRDITFRLTQLEVGAIGGLMAVGKLRIAGVEREVVLPLTTQQRDGTLVVTGRMPLLMTDYGIKPPTAMLGALRTHPKVTVTFEVALSASGT